MVNKNRTLNTGWIDRFLVILQWFLATITLMVGLFLIVVGMPDAFSILIGIVCLCMGVSAMTRLWDGKSVGGEE